MSTGAASRSGWRKILPGAVDGIVGRTIIALYYVIYLTPIAIGVRLDASRAYWLLSGVALATAAVWLYERGGFARAMALVLNALSAFGNILLLVSLYIQGQGFNAQFFHHTDWETLVAGSRALRPLAIIGVSYWILVTLWPYMLSAAVSTRPRPRRRTVAAVLALAVLLNGATLSLGWYIGTELVAANRIVFVPTPVRPVQPAGIDKPRNLVVVVAESLEATLSREEVVGEDLTPALTDLAAEGIQFTDMRQVSHAGWSTGGLIAASCAVPVSPRVYLQSHSWRTRADARMLGARCLGDVLSVEGYRAVFMVGHRLTFANVGNFLAAHGFPERLGLNALASTLRDPAYRTTWGLYDDTLLERARGKLEELSAGSGPFALVVLTMDTHFPPGYPSRSCGQPDEDEHAAFTVRCADRLLSAFIRDVRSSLPDAVVVLYSDHLWQGGLHDLLPAAFEALPGGVPSVDVMPRMVDFTNRDDHPGVRRLRFTIWDATRPPQRIDRPGTHFDIMPTVLDVLGFDAWTEHGFGASLLRAQSPWMHHPNPDALQIVHGPPNIRLAPEIEVSFFGEGPVIDIDGTRMLATGRALSFDDTAFGIAFDAHGRAARVLDAQDVEAALAEGRGPMVVGVSSRAVINDRLPGAAGSELAWFAGHIGSSDLAAGPLPPSDGSRTLRVGDVCAASCQRSWHGRTGAAE